MWGLFIPGQKKAFIFVIDTVRSNEMPGLTTMYNTERSAYLARPGIEQSQVPAADHSFDVRMETDPRQVFRQLGRLLANYIQACTTKVLKKIYSPMLRSVYIHKA